jgi:methyltransferase (TIGR00027 family)
MGVVDDPYAKRMLPRRWAPMALLLRLPALRRLTRSPIFAYLAGRTRFYDEFVANALDRGIRQVVVVAAGYDSRAWRFARDGVTFFEVDLPETQADKRSHAPHPGPVYVPADVTDPSLADNLIRAGFRPEQPTAFTVEGLTMYLTEGQVARMLRMLADLGAPGSRLAVNFGMVLERQASPAGGITRRLITAGGEQFRFRLDLADAPPFLAKAGWSVERTLTGAELRDRYLKGTDFAAADVSSTSFALEAVRQKTGNRAGEP